MENKQARDMKFPDGLAEALRPPEPITPLELKALNRLVDIALSGTGQARVVANFLLAWWNSDECGGFDLTDLWALDLAIVQDVILVFGLIARISDYPNNLDASFDQKFRELVRQWRKLG